jgi:hypothetical protein
VKVGDQLAAALEGVEQRERPVGPGECGCGIHLDHRQTSPARRDRVPLAGVRLLPDPQLIQLVFERRSIQDARHRVMAIRLLPIAHIQSFLLPDLATRPESPSGSTTSAR